MSGQFCWQAMGRTTTDSSTGTVRVLLVDMAEDPWVAHLPSWCRPSHVPAALARSALAGEPADLVMLHVDAANSHRLTEKLAALASSRTPCVLVAEDSARLEVVDPDALGRVDHFVPRGAGPETFRRVLEAARVGIDVQRRNLSLQREVSNQAEQLCRVARLPTLADRQIGTVLDELLREAVSSASLAQLQRVALFAMALGKAMGLDANALSSIACGALLHDIGKVGIPDSILADEQALTPDEEALLRAHPLLGFQLLESVEVLAAAAEIVLQHHERLDGSGYPVGLRDRAIGVGARVFAVADTIDTMTRHRPWQGPAPFDEVREALMAGAGKVYDADVVAAFRRIPEEDWRAAIAVGQARADDQLVAPPVLQTWRQSYFVRELGGEAMDPWQGLTLGVLLGSREDA